MLLACLGGAVVLATITIASFLSSGAIAWPLAGAGGVAILGVIALRCWIGVRAHGFYERRTDEGEDEDGDGIDEGGRGPRRLPPDEPDGDGALRFDWDRFVTDFWAYVEHSREHELTPV